MQKNPPAPTYKAPAENFVGDVHVTMLFTGDGVSELNCGLVRFTPGARTNWHRHANGQLLVCTDGVGLVGTREGDTVVLRPGESVWIAADEDHFHGATAETTMSHYAVFEGTSATTWFEPVTDEQYTAAHQSAGVLA